MLFFMAARLCVCVQVRECDCERDCSRPYTSVWDVCGMQWYRSKELEAVLFDRLSLLAVGLIGFALKRLQGVQVHRFVCIRKSTGC